MYSSFTIYISIVLLEISPTAAGFVIIDDDKCLKDGLDTLANSRMMMGLIKWGWQDRTSESFDII